MNFTRFPANTTNIFPIANSKTGGQLLTEFNLRSRESVLTDENVEYMIGPSYCHSQSDFTVRIQQDELGVAVSSTTLEITAGRALVNGHFVESLVNVTVDLAEANKQLKSEGFDELKGHLAIGLRAMYSTEQTLSASLRIETNQSLMAGIQIVILPIGKIQQGYFVLPSDSPDSDELVTAHLKLAEFYYINGQIRSITQNESKIQAIPASRVGHFEDLLADHYVTRDGLNPKRIYTMAGKVDESTSELGKSTWCDSTDSLFIWEQASSRKTINNINNSDYLISANQSANAVRQYLVNPATLKQADFFVNPKTEEISLALPHKAVDGKMWSSSGVREIYDPRILTLPQADFVTGKPGTVSSEYTQNVKEIRELISNIYSMPAGKQRGYVEVLDADRTNLPTLNSGMWSVGDYVIVREDNSVYESMGSSTAPATMYVVIPPLVTQVSIFNADSPRYDDKYATEEETAWISGVDGAEIHRVVIDYASRGSDSDDEAKIKLNLSPYINPADPATYNDSLGITSDGQLNPDSTIRGMYKTVTSDSVVAYGESDSSAEVTILLEGKEKTYQDYVTLKVTNVPETINGQVVKRTRYYYYLVSQTKDTVKEYSIPPIILTGNINLATTSSIGGFLNVSESDLDAGYVIRDTSGHLRLLDYALLRSGVLAYQLGQDYDFGTGLIASDLQNELDEYVNSRVAFPTSAQIAKSVELNRSPNIIEIHLNLNSDDSYSTINVENIDSRWGTVVHFIISGTADFNTTLNFTNCERIMITLNLNVSSLDIESGYGPTINLYNCNLYYDASVIDYIHRCPRSYSAATSTSADNQPIYKSGFTGIENLTIWYEKFENDDPNLIVEGMTITEVDTPIIPDDIEFWNIEVVNDNHYYYGLQSITLDPQGNLAGCGLYMRNDTTANVDLGKSIAASTFVIPQGSGFSYPETSITKQIKINGSFITAYPSDSGYITVTTEFTALSQRYISDDAETGSEIGTISFLSNSELIENCIFSEDLEEGQPIDGWATDSYQVFKGWTIG